MCVGLSSHVWDLDDTYASAGSAECILPVRVALYAVRLGSSRLTHRVRAGFMSHTAVVDSQQA